MKARKVHGLDPAGPLDENAARIVLVRLEELRSFAVPALEEPNVTEQHDLRIAAKRLRYLLETTEFCFGEAGLAARRSARELQGILGDLHDCDVMLPLVTGHLAELRAEDVAAVRRRAGAAAELAPELAARAPHRTAYRGLEVLSVYLEARRRLLFERFVDFWKAQGEAQTWMRLEREARHSLSERQPSSA